jgi:hypothetical protein
MSNVRHAQQLSHRKKPERRVVSYPLFQRAKMHIVAGEFVKVQARDSPPFLLATPLKSEYDRQQITFFFIFRKRAVALFETITTLRALQIHFPKEI